jgi:MFS family permease
VLANRAGDDHPIESATVTVPESDVTDVTGAPVCGGADATGAYPAAVGDVAETAFDVATSDFRIAGLQLVSGLLSIIPLLGPLLATITTGLATQCADETIGNDGPRNSIGIRFVYGLIAALLVGIIVSIGFVFLILPGIYLALKLSLAIPSIWVGDKGPLEALSDSWSRTGGNLLTILGVGLLFFVIAMVLFIPVFVLSVGSAAAAETAQAGSSLLLTSPLLIGAIILVAVTIGSVSTAAQTIMYRSFGDNTMTAESGLDSETQF